MPGDLGLLGPLLPKPFQAAMHRADADVFLVGIPGHQVVGAGTAGKIGATVAKAVRVVVTDISAAVVEHTSLLYCLFLFDSRLLLLLSVWTVAVVSGVPVVDLPLPVRGDQLLLHGDGEEMLLVHHDHEDEVTVQDLRKKNTHNYCNL